MPTGHKNLNCKRFPTVEKENAFGTIALASIFPCMCLFNFEV